MSSAREIVERTISRIVLGDSRSSVFTRIYDDKARTEAVAVDARQTSGITLGPLDGLLVSVKDSFDICGEPTTAGSKILRDAPLAKEDALVVKRLRRAGAIVLGKTNMSEFAFSGLGINLHYGTPENALDPERIPGGSSSGAAVSVAEDTCAVAIGTDTGGSVRIPAAFNGVVGFKPSTGRVPTWGVQPLSFSLDTIGVMARTVQACSDANAVIAGDEASLLPQVSFEGLRIAVPRGILLSDMESVVSEGFERSIILLSRLGAKIIDFSIDDLLEARDDCLSSYSIAAMEACSFLGTYLEDDKDQLDPYVYKALEHNSEATAMHYIRVMRRRRELIAAFDERLSAYDVLALPTTPITAPLTKPLLENETEMSRLDKLIIRNPSIANFFNLTSISLPMPRMLFPAGIMFMARNGFDNQLLAWAKAAESTFFDNND